MALDNIINVGKYEAILYIHDEQTANEYLKACIDETARHSGCDTKQAAAIEKENILAFTHSECNRATQKLFKDLLARIVS